MANQKQAERQPATQPMAATRTGSTAQDQAARATAASQARPAGRRDIDKDKGEKRLDETIPGGAYIRDGVVVNAHGEPLEGYDIDEETGTISGPGLDD